MSARSAFNFTITEGSDELSIELCANACYLRLGEPAAVIFDGGDPEFYDLTPHYARLRKEINQWIGDKLNTDFQGSETDFLELLEPVLSKLSNGKYLLSLDAEIHHNYTVRTAEWKNSEPELMELVFGKVINPAEQEKLPAYRSNSAAYDLVQQTTTDIYDPFEEGDSYSYHGMLPILTTKPEKDMDLKAVRYFEDRIRKKERPVVLLFRAFCEGEYWDIPYVLLDGHHKFRAYQNLGIIPRIAIITRAFTPDTVRFRPDELIDCLYPWQSRHIFGSAPSNERQIKSMLENPDSKVHQFVRNGLVRTYYDNGQLKQEGTYEFNKPQGIMRGWYQNGQLEYENEVGDGSGFIRKVRYYENGRMKEHIRKNEPGERYTKTTWYESGAMELEADFDWSNYMELPPIKTWFENGQLQKEFLGTNRSNGECRLWNEAGELIEHFTLVSGTQTWILKPQSIHTRSELKNESPTRSSSAQRENQPRNTAPKDKPFDYQLLWIILIFVLLLIKVILLIVI